MNKNMNNQSPLRYPGGKTRACKILDAILREHFDVQEFDTIVSPFFGGGSFEFYLQNKYNYSILANDKFTPLYHFWKTCKYNNAELCEELYKKLDQISSKEEFKIIRNKIMVEENDILQSIMYFIINRCSFSGATLSGGFSLEASKKRFTSSSIKKIGNLDLTRFTIYNLDFKDFIETISTHATSSTDSHRNILFLDPPYYLENGSKLYGNNGDMHETFDHMLLYKCLSKEKNWIMTYNNCDYIKELYKNYKIIETSWSYGMNRSKESSEIVIIG